MKRSRGLRSASRKKLSKSIRDKGLSPITRSLINYKEGENWSFANRFETSLIDFDNTRTNGYMLYQDIKYKPLF